MLTPTTRHHPARFATATVAAAGLVLAMAMAPATAAPALRAFLELALSPDGRYVASVEGLEGESGGAPQVRELVIRATEGEHETRVALPCGAVPECWPSAPAWTTDGRTLSFALRQPGSRARSIYQVDRAGGVPQLRLAFDGTITALRHGPDGSLAMLATAGATKEIGATAPGAPLTGELDAATPTQRLAVLEPGADRLRWVSPEGLFVYEYDRRPDGRGFVGTAAPGDGDRQWWVARLFAFDADGQAPRLLYAPRSTREQLATPRVSPDGRHVALIAGLMSDFGSTGGELLRVPTAGGPARNLTPRSTRTITGVDWACDGRLRATALAGEFEQRLDFGPGGTAAPVLRWQTPASRESLDAACAAEVEVAVQQSFTEAPELVLGREGRWSPLTRANAGHTVGYQAQPLTWRYEGWRLQGWVLLPPSRPADGAKLPMVVTVHGGPAAAFRPRFMANGGWRALLEHGYALLLPNPRGSFGQGEAFTQANVKDFGGGDLRDILAGVDAALRRFPVDPQRLGLTGHSYGGFMTMWAVTQTTRFKAAAAGAGIANWQSYYGQNGISEWMPPYFGATVYADPAVYAKSSPIGFIRRVRTPTFAYVGEADIECPAAQTLEFGRALQTLGVPASTVIYPGEGHGLSRPETRADLERRMLAWFDRYLKP